MRARLGRIPSWRSFYLLAPDNDRDVGCESEAPRDRLLARGKMKEETEKRHAARDPRAIREHGYRTAIES
jgi:hypothetical protein